MYSVKEITMLIMDPRNIGGKIIAELFVLGTILMFHPDCISKPTLRPTELFMEIALFFLSLSFFFFFFFFVISSLNNFVSFVFFCCTALQLYDCLHLYLVQGLIYICSNLMDLRLRTSNDVWYNK